MKNRNEVKFMQEITIFFSFFFITLLLKKDKTLLWGACFIITKILI